MSSKVSNIIAIELAILIGLMSWMACFLYSHLPSARRTTAAIQERAADRVATAAPLSEASDRPPYAVDYRARRPAYEEPAEMAQEYDQDYQDIGTEPDASAGLEDNSNVRTSQSYEFVQPAYVASPRNVAYQRPVQNVAYEQPVQNVEYEQPEEIVEYQQSPQIVLYQEPAAIVGYGYTRRFAKRFRSTTRDCGFITATAQFPSRIGTHRQCVNGFVARQNVNGFVARQNANGFVARQNMSGFVASPERQGVCAASPES